MENPSKIILFGDSITKGYTPTFEKTLRSEYPEIELTTLNAGVSGETTRDGLLRLRKVLDESPDIVVIGFGMNDWRKGVNRSAYKQNLLQMVDAFENIGTRVIVCTVSPSYDFHRRRYNYQVDDYSEAVREIAYERRIKIADINALWKRELKRPKKGLRDDFHPNRMGYGIICKALMWVVPRKHTTVLWQYNGHEAKCNYRCPYCYYIGLHSTCDMSFGSMEEWHEGLKRSFGNQHLVVYLGFGEPTLGRRFPEIIEMFQSEPNWELRIVSNLDTKQIKNAAVTKLAESKRLHIVGSFHPCMTNREKYLERLIYFRENGIEVPSVFVAYPEYLSRFVDDIEYFRKHGFLIHVRRFQGLFNKKTYPYAYTDAERRLTARYMDVGMLKYMLSGVSSHGELTYVGFHFFVMDNVGNIGYDSNIFHPYTGYRCIFGNILQGNFRPLLLPGPYPGTFEGTDDGIANVIKHGYKELEGNHVESFAKQGGVYKDTDGRVIYENEFKDFDDPRLRAEYNFPPQRLHDYLSICMYSDYRIVKQSIKLKAQFAAKEMLSSYPNVKRIVENILPSQ